MENIGYGFIQGTGDYIDLETALSLSLVQDKKYAIQIQGSATFCEGTSKPLGGGTFWNVLKPFGYIKDTETLWIKPKKGDSVFINVTEVKQ